MKYSILCTSLQQQQHEKSRINITALSQAMYCTCNSDKDSNKIRCKFLSLSNLKPELQSKTPSEICIPDRFIILKVQVWDQFVFRSHTLTLKFPSAWGETME
jgi:hypothetical protein